MNESVATAMVGNTYPVPGRDAQCPKATPLRFRAAKFAGHVLADLTVGIEHLIEWNQMQVATECNVG